MSLNFGRSAAVAAFTVLVSVSNVCADAPRAADEQKKPTPTVAERLQPSASSILAAPVKVRIETDEKPGPSESTMRPVSASSSTALIAAGLVLLVAGAIVDGDAGTLLMVGGAGITAYGVYLYVQ